MDQHSDAAKQGIVRSPVFSTGEWSEVVASLRFSPQQARIVELMLEGKSDKEIAADMKLRFSTVRTYMSRLFARVGASDRTDLLVRVFGHFRRECRTKGCPRNC